MKEHLFKLAKQETEKAIEDCSNRAKIGCVISYHGTVIAKGHNSDKSHTVQCEYNKERYEEIHKYRPCLHAEIMALNKIKYLDIDFSKVIITTYREKRDGTLGLARPCPSCLKRIKDMGIKTMYYTGEESYIKEELK